MNTTISVKDIVSNNNIAKFDRAIAGVLYYKVITSTNDVYEFSVDMNDKEDVSTATFENEHKAITLMRYINKAIKSGTLVSYKLS